MPDDSDSLTDLEVKARAALQECLESHCDYYEPIFHPDFAEAASPDRIIALVERLQEAETARDRAVMFHTEEESRRYAAESKADEWQRRALAAEGALEEIAADAPEDEPLSVAAVARKMIAVSALARRGAP